jgi:hypothetical protein
MLIQYKHKKGFVFPVCRMNFPATRYYHTRKRITNGIECDALHSSGPHWGFLDKKPGTDPAKRNFLCIVWFYQCPDITYFFATFVISARYVLFYRRANAHNPPGPYSTGEAENTVPDYGPAHAGMRESASLRKLQQTAGRGRVI